MKRHDTHLLSDESGNELKDGKDAHKYCFNNSNNSSNFSEEKLISKKSEHNSPKYLNINHLNQNINNVYKDKNDVTKKDISIISTKELEDIFCKENYNINNSQKKKKPKNNKYFIKLKKLKLNNENNEEIIDYFLTYNLALRNDYIDKKIVKNRNCISLNNKEKIIYKNNRAKFTKSKNLDDFKEKEILYFFYNDDSEGNKKLQKVINIINKTKLQLLKVSNSNFTKRLVCNCAQESQNAYSFLTGYATEYLDIRIDSETSERGQHLIGVCMVKGETAPEQYIPYGYKIPVTCGGETTNIYIGDTPLGTGQTVTGAQTGVAIPTVSGTNTLSVGTTVQPSGVSINANPDMPTPLERYLFSKFIINDE